VTIQGVTPAARLQNKGGVFPEGLQISFYCLKPKLVKNSSHLNPHHRHCEYPANRVLSSDPQRDRMSVGNPTP